MFGSFKDFPPVLIDVGADEVLLSDAVKLAECIALAGSEVQLDVWKDMIHIFPWFATEIPEDASPRSVPADGFETGWDTEQTMHTGFNETDYLETKSLLLR